MGVVKEVSFITVNQSVRGVNAGIVTFGASSLIKALNTGVETLFACVLLPDREETFGTL